MLSAWNVDEELTQIATLQIPEYVSFIEWKVELFTISIKFEWELSENELPEEKTSEEVSANMEGAELFVKLNFQH